MPPRRRAIPEPVDTRNLPTTARELSEVVITNARTEVLATGLQRSQPSTIPATFRSNILLVRQAAEFSTSPGQPNVGTLLDFKLREQNPDEFAILEAAITTAAQRDRFR